MFQLYKIMDEVDFTDEGIPVFHVRNQSASSSIMSVGQRKASLVSRESPVRGSPSPATDWAGNLVGIFQVDSKSYDVILSEETISWTPLTGTVKRKSSRRGKKKPQDSALNLEKGEYVLHYKDIIGAKIKRERRASQKPGQGVCLGVAVFLYEWKEPNKLRDQVLLFGHPSEEICIEWVKRIQNILAVKFPERPKKMKIFLQPFAGKKQTRSLYQEHIHPLFTAANIDLDMTEVMHNEQIKQEMIHINLADYDRLVCVGGDGTATTLINHLLQRVQQDEGREPRLGFTPSRPHIPIGIIPCGTTNHIIHSLHGIDDAVTATIHIILGHTQSVDVCSVYSKDKFHRWAFNSQYGFAGNAISFIDRYKVLGEKRMEASFLKALTKSKFRPYEVEIRYLPSTNASNSHPKDKVVCTTGCDVCQVVTEKTRNDSVYSDELEVLDPLNNSNSSSIIADLSKENPYRVVKGTYLNVELLTLSGRCDMAPQGLSKYTHAGDGCMDIVLVKDVNRKEFIRFLKRHGNSKNQLDLPFVESFRCTEVSIRPRLPTTWRHKDFGYNEIDYELEKKDQNRTNGSDEIVLDDLDVNDSDEDSDIEDVSCSVTSTAGGIENASFWGDHSSKSSSPVSEANETAPKTNANGGNVYTEGSKIYVSELERERIRLRQKHEQKLQKKKTKDEAKSSSVWNIDNDLYTDQELEFRIHPQLIKICGLGVSPKTEPKEIMLGWLPRI